MFRSIAILFVLALILSSCNKKIHCKDGEINFNLREFAKTEKDTVIINIYQSDTLIQSDTNYCTYNDSNGNDAFENIDSAKKYTGNYIHNTRFSPYTGRRCEIILPIINRKFVLENINLKQETKQVSYKEVDVCYNKEMTYTLNGTTHTTDYSIYYVYLAK